MLDGRFAARRRRCCSPASSLLRWPRLDLGRHAGTRAVAAGAPRRLAGGVRAGACSSASISSTSPACGATTRSTGCWRTTFSTAASTRRSRSFAHSHSSFHALSNYPIAGRLLALRRRPDHACGCPASCSSALCVPLLYATFAPLFGSTVALLAALFCASSPPQLIHAKELVQIVTGQFFQLAGMCLLVRGIDRRTHVADRRRRAAAGAVRLHVPLGSSRTARRGRACDRGRLGAPAARPPVAPGQRSRCARRSAGGRPRSQAVALAAALLVFAAGAGPRRDRLRARSGCAGAARRRHLDLAAGARRRRRCGRCGTRLWRTLLVFHYQQGPEYHWFGIGTDPAVNVVIGFLLVHGLVQSLLRWREPRHCCCSSGSRSASRRACCRPARRGSTAPSSPCRRSTSGRRCRSRACSPPPRRAARGAPCALSPSRCWWPCRSSTSTTTSTASTRIRSSAGSRASASSRWRAPCATAGPGWTGYLLADNFEREHESFRFLSRAWGLHLVDVRSLSDVLPLRDAPERGALFIMSHGARGAAPAIAHMYPGAALVERREPAPRSWWFDALVAVCADRRRAAASAPRSTRSAAPSPTRRGSSRRGGSSADYDVAGRMVVRHEPYPFYSFLAPTFAQRVRLGVARAAHGARAGPVSHRDRLECQRQAADRRPDHRPRRPDCSRRAQAAPGIHACTAAFPPRHALAPSRRGQRAHPARRIRSAGLLA